MEGIIVTAVVLGISFVVWILGKIGEAAASAQRRTDAPTSTARSSEAQRQLEQLLRNAGVLGPDAKKPQPRRAPPPQPAPRARKLEAERKALAASAFDEHGGRLDAHRLGTTVDPSVGSQMRARHLDPHPGKVTERHVAINVGATQSVSAEAVARARRRSGLERLERLAPLQRAVVLAEILGPPPSQRRARI